MSKQGDRSKGGPGEGGAKPTTQADAARVQSANAKANGGRVDAGSQAARMQSAADRRADGKS